MPAREFKGKSVDLAIFAGLDAMGLSIDEVSIEILSDGTGGFLGMKKACVRMTPKSELSEEEIRLEEEEIKRAEEELKRERKLRESDITEAPRKKERNKGGRKREERAEKEEVHFEPAVYEDAETPCTAEPFLSEILRIFDIDAKCKTVKAEEENMQKMVIEGADTAILIGRRGETLDALQYLCSLVANKGEKDYVRVSIDTENYRQKREAALTQLAKRIASKVVRTGRSVKLEPMNPYERRILHYALQKSDKVETISEGEDPYRRVVVRLKRKSAE